MKNAIITLLRTFHTGLVIFLITGWLWPGAWTPLVHAVFAPLVILHWRFNRGICVLTDWEYRLRGTPEAEWGERNRFVRSLIRPCVRGDPTDQAIEFWSHVVIWGAFGLSVTRFWLFRAA